MAIRNGDKVKTLGRIVPTISETLFHSLAGKSVTDREDSRFRQYRKEWETNPQKGIVSDFPLHLDIEATTRCNLRCPFCASTHNRYPIGDMKRETWTAILNEAGSYGLYALKFNYRGEPTLHPDLVEMVAYAKSVGVMDVYFNTNATLLTEKLIRALIFAGLDRISISFDGYDRETYESLRVGASFKKVIRNVKMLRKIRDDLYAENPHIRIQTVLNPGIDKGKYAKFWEDHVDEVSCLELKAEEGNPDHTGMISDWACSMLWQRLTITWDGKILPCCHDIYEWMRLGEIGTTSIVDAWHQLDEEQIRTYHHTGQAHKLAACDRCPLRAMEIHKLL